MHGLALNGSFEETPDLAHWAYGGELPVTLVDDRPPRQPRRSTGRARARSAAALRQSLAAPDDLRPARVGRPVLTFHYRMYVNDILDYSDFYVWLSRPTASGWPTSCAMGIPARRLLRRPGHDMGWRTASYDLTAFKGQHVRLVFENRNLHDDMSLGIWTLVDDVRVVDAGP